MTSVTEIQVTFDCAEPARVARFWCAALGYVIPPSAEGETDWSVAEDPTGTRPRMYFQRVPEGKTAKNRLHLDVKVGKGLVGDERLAAIEAECARLVPLGAVRGRLLLADDENESCLNMQDPEGNEFCLD